jgi:hypothetical protein
MSKGSYSAVSSVMRRRWISGYLRCYETSCEDHSRDAVHDEYFSVLLSLIWKFDRVMRCEGPNHAMLHEAGGTVP